MDCPAVRAMVEGTGHKSGGSWDPPHRLYWWLPVIRQYPLLTAVHCAHLLKEFEEIFEQDSLLECCAGREGLENGSLEDTTSHEFNHTRRVS
jgi:hypothetical protein